MTNKHHLLFHVRSYSHCDTETSGEAIFEDHHVADAPRNDNSIPRTSVLPFVRKEGQVVYLLPLNSKGKD
ncbi:MAG: hypothetical protein H6767_01455 [Candidatus Peribacteria bacterium]|nr:MAG: hypothetical protein H6767_01455 [Candidatus Peribacteria bacterium]